MSCIQLPGAAEDSLGSREGWPGQTFFGSPIGFQQTRKNTSALSHTTLTADGCVVVFPLFQDRRMRPCHSAPSAEEDISPTGSLPDNWICVILPKIDSMEPDEAQIMYTRNLGIAASYYLFHGLKETSNNDYLNLAFHVSRFVNIHL